jgi:hypothetical protein
LICIALRVRSNRGKKMEKERGTGIVKEVANERKPGSRLDDR